MKKNIIEEHTTDRPGTVIKDGLVGILNEKGEIIKPIIKKDTDYEGELDLSEEAARTQLRDASFNIGFTCSICGGDKPNELSMPIDDLRNVCGDCYAKGIAWAIRMAAKERNEIK